jgi:hypothetical protein
MAIASGTKFGPYEIQSLLGAGGMSAQKLLACVVQPGGLLYEHATQQNSERANIASEWNFLGGIRGLSGQFEQTIVLISRRPQWRLIHN